MEILIFFVIWIAFGVVGAMIMSSRDRSGCGGFALGVLLGPIGLIIALLIRPSTQHEAERQLRVEELKRGMSGPNNPAPPPQPTRPPRTSGDDVFIRARRTPEGGRQYRWECDRCGEQSEWSEHERSIERQAQSHSCRRAVRRG